MALPLYTYFELLSLLFSLWFFKGLSRFKINLFVLISLVAFLADLIGSIYADSRAKNYFIYNIYLEVSTPLYFYVFFKMLNYKHLAKNIYILICVLIMIFATLNWWFIQHYDSFNTYSLIIIEFVLAILSLLTLLKLFNNDNINVALQNHPFFWIAGSALIYAVSTVVILGLAQFINTHSVQLNGKNLYRVLMPYINIILYSGYCYAFYLCNKATPRFLQR